MQQSYADRVKADLIMDLHDEVVRMTVTILQLSRMMQKQGAGQLAREALRAGWKEGAPKDA